MIKINNNVGGLEGLTTILLPSLIDNTGYSLETYNQEEFNLNIHFIRDKEYYSQKGVLHGLYCQKQYPQTKLIYTIIGSIQIVVLDLRPTSSTFGQWYSEILFNNNNKKQFLIPKGLAYGFQVLSNEAIVCIKYDDIQRLDDENGIIWNDPSLNINWLEKVTALSEKDKKWGTFEEWKNTQNIIS